MWNEQNRIPLGVKEDTVRARAFELILPRFLGIRWIRPIRGLRRVPPASVKALVRAKPFSEEHLNADSQE
jgi:hypothetical protein